MTIVLVGERPELLRTWANRLANAGYEVHGDASAEPGFAPPGSLGDLLRNLSAESGTQVVALRATRAAEDGDAAPGWDLHIDLGRQTVEVAGETVVLTTSEFGLLVFLAERPGQAFGREAIIEAVKGGDYPATPRSVDVQVLGLRRKLGPAGQWIETVRGVGYRFAASGTHAVRISAAREPAGESS